MKRDAFEHDLLHYIKNHFPDMSTQDIMFLLWAGHRIYGKLTYIQAQEIIGDSKNEFSAPLYFQMFYSFAHSKERTIWECNITCFGEKYTGVGYDKKEATTKAIKLFHEWYP